LGDLLSGEEFEEVFGKIYELSHRVNFQIKTTEAIALPALPFATQPGGAATGAWASAWASEGSAKV